MPVGYNTPGILSRIGDAISEDGVGGVTLGKVVVVSPAAGLRFISRWALEDMVGKP